MVTVSRSFPDRASFVKASGRAGIAGLGSSACSGSNHFGIDLPAAPRRLHPTAFRSAAMWLGVVAQQPPMI